MCSSYEDFLSNAMRHHRETIQNKLTHYDETKKMDHASQIVKAKENLELRCGLRQASGTRQRIKVSKGAKIRNQYNQVPHLTQDTNGKVTNSQLDATNESQEVSTFTAGDHKAHINRRAQRHSKRKTEQKHKRSTKEVPPWNGQ